MVCNLQLVLHCSLDDGGEHPFHEIDGSTSMSTIMNGIVNSWEQYIVKELSVELIVNINIGVNHIRQRIVTDCTTVGETDAPLRNPSKV
jgi:hypothetical protein